MTGPPSVRKQLIKSRDKIIRILAGKHLFPWILVRKTAKLIFKFRDQIN